MKKTRKLCLLAIYCSLFRFWRKLRPSEKLAIKKSRNLYEISNISYILSQANKEMSQIKQFQSMKVLFLIYVFY